MYFRDPYNDRPVFEPPCDKDVALSTLEAASSLPFPLLATLLATTRFDSVGMGVQRPWAGGRKSND